MKANKLDKNIEKEELNKFNLLANEWWDPKGKCRPLHELNPTRLQFIGDRCRLAQKRILDIGCGGGILSESMAAQGALVTGIDASSQVLEVAKLHAEMSGRTGTLNYIETTAEDYAELHPASFDVITCLELLEHVPDPRSIIEACAKLIKPKGHLFFSTLNRTPKAYLFAVLGAEYALNLLPRGTHEFEKFIKPSELDEWLRNASLSLKELSGLDYNPFTHTSTLTEDVSINYLAHAVKS